VQRLGDRVLLVGDDVDALERDAEGPQPVGEPRRVGVRDEATEDLVADDEHGRRQHRHPPVASGG
jgi:hypothetical protein